MTGPSPQAETKFIVELNGMLLRNEQPSDFQLAQYKRQAEALMKADPIWGWVAKTAIAAAMWRVDEALDLCRRAKAACGSHPELMMNLAVSLKHLI